MGFAAFIQVASNSKIGPCNIDTIDPKQGLRVNDPDHLIGVLDRISEDDYETVDFKDD